MKQLLLSAALLLALSGIAQAQPGSGGPGPTNPTVDPTATPLDGGASLLLASGVALGVRKLRQRRRAAQA